MPNVYEVLENGTYRKNNGSIVKSMPERGFLKYYTNDTQTPYFVNVVSGESVWELPRNRANSNTRSNASAATIASLESSLSSLRSECGGKDAKIAALEAKLAACAPAAAPAVAAAANNGGPAAKFKKMIKMGVPRPAVEIKMRAEGLDPSLLNAAAAAPAAAAPVAEAAAANNGGPAAKFKKMIKMGVPRPAVEIKMRAEGLDPSLLNAAAAAPVAEAAPASMRPPMGDTIAGMLAAKAAAKKTNVRNFEASLAAAKAAKAAEAAVVKKKPSNGVQSGVAGLAAVVAARAAAKKTNVGNFEASLAAAKAAREAEAAAAKKTGFGAFKSELQQRVAPKTNAPAPAVATRQVLKANNAGPLPKGWHYIIDEDGDKYYAGPTGTTQWNRPSEGGPRKNNRKNRKTRKNRKSSRRTRRN